ncbi:MAG: branched-chain amino acid ABC transporter substrate-binding protein, partial [Firmicutes bacterium]|nr:branched-chain amino acid ABC transporter substrate-binding protein [Bacillota bacterium]
MKINKKHISIILISVMVLASMTGCTTLDNFITGFIDKPQNDTATIQIGVYQPMTGTDSEEAELEIKGIELAHEMYPSVGGKMVELVYADNVSNIHAAESAIKELTVKEPLAILGSYGSVYSLVAGDHIK